MGIQRTFVPQLDRAILKEIKQNDKEIKAQAGDVGKSRSKVSAAQAAREDAAAAEGVEEDDAEVPMVVGGGGDEEEGDEDDAKDARRRDKSIDGSDDEDGSDEEMNDAKLEAAFKDSGSEAGDESEEEDEEQAQRRLVKDRAGRIKQLERKIAGASRYVEQVRFDVESGEWCEFDLEVSSVTLHTFSSF